MAMHVLTVLFIFFVPIIAVEDTYFYANPLSKAINKMTANLYLKIVKSNPNRNILISPLSIHTAMSLLYYGARGESKEQLMEALGLVNISEEEHLEEVRYLYDEYKEIDDRNMSMHIANAIFVDDTENVKIKFMNLTRDIFDSEIVEMDFGRQEIVRNTINSWVAHKMRNKVTRVVTEEDIREDTRIMSINSAYFKSRWNTPFNKEFTQQGLFYQSPLTFMRTQFMISRSLVASAVIEDLGSTLVSLPFIIKDHRMLIFYQDSKNVSISELENNLFRNSKLQIKKYLGQLKYRNTELAVPKFESGSSLNLVPFFNSLGVSDIFSPNQSDISGITDTGEGGVSSMVHKTRIEISEEGGTAASANSAVIDSKSRLGIAYLELSVDRPFIFFIYNTRQDIPVFMGKIVDPAGCDGNLISMKSPPYREFKSEKKVKEKTSRRVGNNMKRFNSLFKPINNNISSSLCPSGSLASCSAGCRGNARAHSICIQYCELKC